MLPRLSSSSRRGILVWRPGLLLAIAGMILISTQHGQAQAAQSPLSPTLWGSWATLVYGLAVVAVGWGWVRTQRREFEGKREINRQLREIDHLKDEFLSHISHELRTPLFGMTGLAESLIDSSRQLDPDTRTNLALIASSGRRLGRLVDDIVDYSKLSHTSLKLVKRPVDLYTLADVVLTLARHLAQNKGVHLLRTIPRDLPRAEADEFRLEQILYNLIGSAIRLSAGGNVQVLAKEESDHLEITVSATNVEASIQELRQIGEALARGGKTADKLAVGRIGLDLTITRQLIELHGGKISVASIAGEMSFIFTLPVAMGEFEGESSFVPVADQVDANASDDPPPSKAHQGARILVVDDEPVNRLILNNHLSRQDYEVRMVEGGPQAMELVDKEGFDLVLLDIMMPKMSGYEVCRRLRERWSAQEMPIIFLTAMNEVSDLVDGFSAGGNDYLSKPIAKGELLARVHAQLETLEAHRNLGRLVDQRLAQLKVLSGLLPICSQCKKIRDDEGYWSQLETYIDAHSEAQFSHGICPECVEDLYSDFTGGDGSDS